MVNGQGFVTPVFSHQSFNSGGRWGKKKHRPEPFQVRENSVVGVPNLQESAIDTEEERDADKERKKEEIERRSLTSQYHGVLFLAAN